MRNHGGSKIGEDNYKSLYLNIMAQDSSSILTLIETALGSLLAGGGAVKLFALYQKKRKDDAKDISDLSYKFRKSLEERIEKLEAQREEDEKKILELTRKVAKLEAENKILKANQK